MDIIFIGISGSLGALCRYFIYLYESSLHPETFPIQTLLINLSGCLIAGLLIGFAMRVSPENKHYINLVLIGFVGSFTTFSTFSSETLSLIETRSYLQATINIFSNMIGGLIMVGIGKVGSQIRF